MTSMHTLAYHISSAHIQSHTRVFLVGAEELLNLLANFALGDLDVVLGLAVIGHER